MAKPLLVAAAAAAVLLAVAVGSWLGGSREEPEQFPSAATRAVDVRSKAIKASASEWTAEVSGVTLGMSIDEYREVTGKPPGIQIGTVTGVPQAAFVDGRLEKFNWRFATDKYHVVRAALKAQYPDMDCRQAAAGGGFTHEVCSVGSSLLMRQGQRGDWNSVIWLQPEAAALTR